MATRLDSALSINVGHYVVVSSSKDSTVNSARRTAKNVFEALLRYGHDEDFVPVEGENFEATDAPAGSSEKIEVLRRRIELGQPLWHPHDRIDYTGLTGAIRPRD